MNPRAIGAASDAILDQLRCPATPKNLATARRIAIAVLQAVEPFTEGGRMGENETPDAPPQDEAPKEPQPEGDGA